MAQNVADDVRSAAQSLASPFTKGGKAIAKVGEVASRGMSKKTLPTAPKKGVHASQMKKRSMSSAEQRQHAMMRKRAGR